MRPRRYHKDCGGEVLAHPGQMVSGVCLKCEQTLYGGQLYDRTLTKERKVEAAKPRMSRDEYVAWKAMFFGISPEEADRSVPP